MASIAQNKIAFQTALAHLSLGAGTPGRRIVEMPGRELWQYSLEQGLLMTSLCRNFYAVGRANGWQWLHDINGNGSVVAGTLGLPLLQGGIGGTNCGGFNASLRYLARNVLGLNGVTNDDATTQAAFITRPGTNVIDAAWRGNVRTLQQDFVTLGAYFFMTHSWNRLGGDHFDATTNMVNFSSERDLFWCELADPRLPRAVDGVYTVTVRRAPQPPGPPPYYVVRTPTLKANRHMFPVVATHPTYPGGVGVTQSFINHLPDRTGVWSTLLLVSRTHLPETFRRAANVP